MHPSPSGRIWRKLIADLIIETFSYFTQLLLFLMLKKIAGNLKNQIDSHKQRFAFIVLLLFISFLFI